MEKYYINGKKATKKEYQLQENMTEFESLCRELGIPITIDRDGGYTGHCKALALIANEIILSDNEAVLSLSWEEQKKIITENFFKVFAYLA